MEDEKRRAAHYWTRWFIRYHGLRHPRELGKPEVEAFLTMLAHERKVSASTHRQALSALLFLYKEVLGQHLPWLDDIGRPVTQRRIPTVLTQQEVQRLLQVLEGQVGLLARLLYGTGMRLMECLSLRVKDMDFARQVIVVREGKGGKDRVVMLPQSLQAPLQEQLKRSRVLWESDRAAQRPGVYLPHALGPVRPHFSRCVADQKSHAVGAWTPPGSPPASPRNTPHGFFGRNPQGTG